jgi:hypothetical protein
MPCQPQAGSNDNGPDDGASVDSDATTLSFPGWAISDPSSLSADESQGGILSYSP